MSSKAQSAAPNRSRLILYVTIAVVAIAIVAAVVIGNGGVNKTSSTAPEITTVKVGDPAPDFTVATTNGPFQLAKVAGQPVFVEVFATWCPHCQRETGVINDLYKTYGGKVAFVSVSGSPYGMDQNQPESQADVVNFIQQFNVKYPVAFDPTLDVAKKYLKGGYPTIALIDKSGKVTYLESGEIDQKTLAKKIDGLIGT